MVNSISNKRISIKNTIINKYVLIVKMIIVVQMVIVMKIIVMMTEVMKTLLMMHGDGSGDDGDKSD